MKIFCKLLFTGPTLPYRLHSSAIATSPDGRGVILFGGYNGDMEYGYEYEYTYEDKVAEEDTILELRYDSDKWTTLPQKLKQPRAHHVVIPIT